MVAEKYFDLNGKEKFYNRTTRVDKKAPLVEVYQKLQECSRDYLEHRYHVTCDAVYWKQFLEQTVNYVIWFDYSMNIKLTHKRETQGAHYSGKQHNIIV